MPLQFPPQGTPAWDRYIEQALRENRVDIQRLQRVVPPIPEPQQGVPFLGPVSPSAFGLPSLSSGGP